MGRMQTGALAAGVVAVAAAMSGAGLAGPAAAQAAGQAPGHMLAHPPTAPVLSVSAGGSHTCAVTTGHTLWCWGDNGHGQLGDGTTAGGAVPVQEHTHTAGWASVSAGLWHTCAVRLDHTLWCWGSSKHGELGDGTSAASAVPVQEHTHAAGWASVSAGRWHTCAVRLDHTLWCWGDNGSGQLGDGATTDSAVPVPERTHASWASVSAGWGHTCGVRLNHTLWCWGNNDSGQLGDGTQAGSAVPVQERTHARWASVSAGGGENTCAVRADHTVWCWGNHFGGARPEQEPTHTASWLSVSLGAYHVCGVRLDHTLWCWGDDGWGQLGDGTPTAFNDEGPVQEHTYATNWASVSTGSWHTCAVRLDHTLWCWGNNESGQLGSGVGGYSAVPLRERTHARWALVATGYERSCGIKLHHTLWCWGNQPEPIPPSMGQLPANNPVPVQERTHAADWAAVSFGYYDTCAIRLDRTLWCGGDIIGGAVLAQERTHARWIAVDAVWGHTCAVRLDHTLWCWGSNRYGQLGDGTTTSSPVPVQEHTHSAGWTAVSVGWGHTCALKFGHSLWCWGNNEYGQLGDGTHAGSTVPVQERTHAGWASVSAGERHTCAVRLDHTLWCWGNNEHGQLGDGTTTGTAVPVQVPARTAGWASVSAGDRHTCGVRLDRTLWCWGGPPGGSVPVQVPTHTARWASVSADGGHTCALKLDHTLWCWGANGNGQLADGVGGYSALPLRVAGMCGPGPGGTPPYGSVSGKRS